MWFKTGPTRTSAVKTLSENVERHIQHNWQFTPPAVPLLALYCSSHCPVSLILQAQDLAAALGQVGTAVVGGFHSPVEKEMLTVLLRGKGPLVICPARALEGRRLPAAWRGPLEAGMRMLLTRTRFLLIP